MPVLCHCPPTTCTQCSHSPCLPPPLTLPPLPPPSTHTQLAGTLQEQLYGEWRGPKHLWRDSLLHVRSAEDIEEEEREGGIRRPWLSQFEFIKLFSSSPLPTYLGWMVLYHRMPSMEKGMDCTYLLLPFFTFSSHSLPPLLSLPYLSPLSPPLLAFPSPLPSLSPLPFPPSPLSLSLPLPFPLSPLSSSLPLLLVPYLLTYLRTYLPTYLSLSLSLPLTHLVIHPVRCAICTRKPVVSFR